MSDQAERLEPEQLPFQIEEILGEILLADQPYPGVYYVAVQKENAGTSEYYIVMENTSVISQTVKKYGRTVEGCPGLLIYPLSEDKSGWRLIDYEGLKYLTSNHLPIPESGSFRETAVYSMEYHPEYFGDYPVPTFTPTGYTLRHKRLDNGIYWLETDRCKQMLSICYPVWSSELSTAALSLGQQTECDRTQGIKNTVGCLFFSKRDSCIPLYELLYLRNDWHSSDEINVPALMNAIWRDFPEYAAFHNLGEQSGANDLLGLILNAVGGDVELSGSMKNMISLSPQTGTNFFQW